MQEKVLVACEESQAVTKELRAWGVEAYSCDIQDCSGGEPEWHIKGDAIKEAYSGNYTHMIAHPPCTYLSVSGAGWMYHPYDKDLPTKERRPHPKHPNRRQQQKDALEFVRLLMNAPIEFIAIENPVSVISSQIRKPDQIIEPYQFGDPHNKKTCLWLKGFPKLTPTDIVEPEYIIGKKDGKRYSMIHYMSVGKNKDERSKLRSKTFPGIAKAIADQWFGI